MSYADKVVVITGASSGIGKELAAQLAVQGARLVLADLQEGASVQQADGAPALFIRTDVSQQAGVRYLFDEVRRKGLRIDYFFSNAGISLPMNGASSEDDWTRMLSTNLMSHVRVGRCITELMATGSRPHLVITASASSFLSELTSIGYATTKYATFGYAEWMAFSYRKQGLKVSVACPEAVWTPLIDDIPYLQAGAISVQEAARQMLRGTLEDKFLITTHEGTVEKMQQKYADVDGYVRTIADFREDALRA
ncbi:SDR family NAD(P)-dependent oxidoreductase [Caldimonas brevitalea]|uniref:SDR family NAD(P)-dependent oxidoreductase n=1 Tax=Caldimonas brevitalea TaxID=413882 RepID=UPI00063FEF2C|nr:SDR family oxidoreductase [Caldimonas brevitalea]